MPLAGQSTPPARPQAPPQAPPIFRAGTEVVRLDVSVLDRNRAPVRGLTAGDFTLLEDGHAQTVAALSEVTVPEGYAKPPVWAKAAASDIASNDIGDKRLFAIVFDGLGPRATTNPAAPGGGRGGQGGGAGQRPDNGLAEAVAGIARSIIARLGPGDMAAIIGGGCIQPFTDDRDRLNAVLDTLRPGGGGACTPFVARRDQGRTHPVLRDLAEYLAVVPQRRKAIIYIGTGAGLNAGGGGRGGGLRGGTAGDERDDLTATLRFAQLANVNIYPINPYVLGPSGPAGRLDTLRTLAQATGGFAILDSARYDDDLSQVFAENGSYYILGYQPPHAAADGRFHRLTIRVNGRPDLLVRARDEWFRARPAAGTPAEAARPSADTASRLDGLLPDLDVTFDASILPFAQAGAAKTGVAIVTELTEPVAPGVARVVQRMDLKILAYAEGGALAGSASGSASLDLVPSEESRIHYALLSHLDLAPGRYTLRLVAQNPATDKVGSAELPVTVPDFANEAVSLSGLALALSSAASTRSFGTLEPLVPVVPTALRTFLANDRVSAFARVYEGGEEPRSPATLSARVLDAAGRVALDASRPLAPADFGDGRAADFRVDLPLSRLAPGPYLFTVEATRGARRSPTRDIVFTIR